jgi:hypothetical protein
VFESIALGPATSHFWTRLVEECTTYWKDGHEMCDAVSLTNQPCIYQARVIIFFKEKMI